MNSKHLPKSFFSRKGQANRGLSGQAVKWVAIIALFGLVLIGNLAQLFPSSAPTAAIFGLSRAETNAPAGCNLPPVDITKSVVPSDPHTEAQAIISFDLNDLNFEASDIVLVHDISGSMGGQKLADAKADAIAFVNATSDLDRTAVTTFDNDAELRQPLTSDKQTVIDTINSLTSGSGSNMLGGMSLAQQELIESAHHNPNTVKAMILLTDGRVDEDAQVLAQAEIARDCGIMVFAIGLGTNVDETLLEDTTTVTDGRYTHTDTTNTTTLYQEIAMQHRNLLINDILPAGVAVDCDQIPAGWVCTPEADGTTTMTYGIDNQRPLPNPTTLSFTATVSLEPDFETQLVNAPGSCISYDGPSS